MEDIRKYLLRKACGDIKEAIRSLSDDCNFEPIHIINTEYGDYAFEFKVEVFWQICDYIEYNDECDYDYTGDYDTFRLLSARAFDEDGEVEVSEELIKEFNDKYA